MISRSPPQKKYQRESHGPPNKGGRRNARLRRTLLPGHDREGLPRWERRSGPRGFQLHRLPFPVCGVLVVRGLCVAFGNLRMAVDRVRGLVRCVPGGFRIFFLHFVTKRCRFPKFSDKFSIWLWLTVGSWGGCPGGEYVTGSLQSTRAIVMNGIVREKLCIKHKHPVTLRWLGAHSSEPFNPTTGVKKRDCISPFFACPKFIRSRTSYTKK